MPTRTPGAMSSPPGTCGSSWGRSAATSTGRWACPDPDPDPRGTGKLRGRVSARRWCRTACARWCRRGCRRCRRTPGRLRRRRGSGPARCARRPPPTAAAVVGQLEVRPRQAARDQEGHLRCGGDPVERARVVDRSVAGVDPDSEDGLPAGRRYRRGEAEADLHEALPGGGGVDQRGRWHVRAGLERDLPGAGRGFWKCRVSTAPSPAPVVKVDASHSNLPVPVISVPAGSKYLARTRSSFLGTAMTTSALISGMVTVSVTGRPPGMSRGVTTFRRFDVYRGRRRWAELDDIGSERVAIEEDLSGVGRNSVSSVGVVTGWQSY